MVRQLGKPNLLAATYASNAAAAATAAMEELEETLLGSLQELHRIGSGVGEAGGWGGWELCRQVGERRSSVVLPRCQLFNKPSKGRHLPRPAD